MSNINTITGPMRMPFLVLAPACVFLGLGSAVWTTGSYSPLYAILALLGAVAAHISVNALNEYFDFKSGLDMKTTRTPFSGGSGTLPVNPGKSKNAWLVGFISLAIAALVGVYFLTVWGLGLLPLGLLGLLVVFTYTIWLTRSPLLCLVAPGLGFGTFMVMGTHFVLTGVYSWTAFIASLIPFFLVSNLLLLNQFPDVEPDASIGRRHYPILLGRKKSAIIYISFLLMTYLSIVIGVAMRALPPFTLLGLLTLFIAVPASLKVYQNADQLPQLMPALGMNVILNLLTPVLVGIGFLIG
jgi:1,4-dihydroxy-2-naphthoate polyprenyltransferase